VLFDGQSLNGWQASDAPGTFSVKDGELIVHGPRSHLYYTGSVHDHDWKNFEFTGEVLTFEKANSGVYFTPPCRKKLARQGFEVQVNIPQRGPKRTAGLYDIAGEFEILPVVVVDGAGVVEMRTRAVDDEFAVLTEKVPGASLACQPFSDWPSNSTCQSADFSARPSGLGAAARIATLKDRAMRHRIRRLNIVNRVRGLRAPVGE